MRTEFDRKEKNIQVSKTNGYPKITYPFFIAVILERAVFYGARAILIVYAAEVIYSTPISGIDDFLNEYLISIYSNYITWIGISSIVGGVIGDRLLKRNTLIIIGKGLTALGYLILATKSETTFIVGLVISVVGWGLYRPNIMAVFSNGISRDDPRRKKTFLFWYLGVNIGAIIGILSATFFEYSTIFYFSAFITLLGIIPITSMFKLVKNKLEPPKHSKSTMAIGLTLLWTSVMFFYILELAFGEFSLSQLRDKRYFLADFEVPATCIDSMNAVFILFLSPLVFKVFDLILAKRSKSFELCSVAIGFVVLTFGLLAMANTDLLQNLQQTEQSNFEALIVFNVICTLAELLIIPIVWSFISKNSGNKWQSTIFGLFLASAVIFNLLIEAIVYYNYLDKALIIGGISISSIVLVRYLPCFQKSS